MKTSRRIFRESGVITVLLPYLQANEPLVKAIALFVLAFVADISADDKIIQATASNIEFIIGTLLKPAIESENRRCQGFSVEEIMVVLSLLSRNRENAKEMGTQGMLETRGAKLYLFKHVFLYRNTRRPLSTGIFSALFAFTN